MPLRRTFAVVLLMIGVSQAFADPSSTDLLISWIDAEIGLQETRYDLILKADYDHPFEVTGDGFTLDERNKADRLSHIAQIKKLKQVKKEIQAANGDENSVITSVARLNIDCDTPGCLKMLGTVNRELAQQIGDISNHIILNNWKDFRIEKGPAQRKNKIEEVANLMMRRYACDRAIGTFKGTVDMNTDKMSRCFASILWEEGKRIHKVPTSSPSWDLAGSRAGSEFWTPQVVMDRIAGEIEKMPDYRVTPWEVFRMCVRESKAAYGDALNICYETLRQNRGRLDFGRKLMDIRGDRNQNGDNSGDWYHFFGLAKGGHVLGNGIYLAYLGELAFEGVTRRFDGSEITNDMRGAEVGMHVYDITWGAPRIQDHFNGMLDPLKSSAEECKIQEIITHH